MKTRCGNPSNEHFKNYGARGIRVLWATFDEFIADMGPRPEGAWIERLNNDLGYGPGNCKWVTPSANQINKRVSKFWVVDGIEYESSVVAARSLGVHPSVVVRGCNGGVHSGRYYPPRTGWSCRFKYVKEEESAGFDSSADGYAMAHASRQEREAVSAGALSADDAVRDEGLSRGAAEVAERRQTIRGGGRVDSGGSPKRYPDLG
jgi:hypothetical protein